MAYKKGQDRRQRVLFPDCIDEYVEADAPVRLFDAFVDNLKMDELPYDETDSEEMLLSKKKKHRKITAFKKMNRFEPIYFYFFSLTLRQNYLNRDNSQQK